MSRSDPHLSEKKADKLPEKEELLEYVLEAKGLKRWKGQSIPPREKSNPPCLSFAQERFWFLEQFEPNHAVYNSCKAERLVGRLNLTALEGSLNAIIRRHEVLRTHFPVIDGRPIPQIVPNLTLALPVLDFRGIPEIEREAKVLRLVMEESKIPFDLSRDPVIRAKVLRSKEEEHILLLVLHQIVFDSWSVVLFFSELWTLYAAYVAGKQPTLKELPIQYSDFAAWQRQLLQGEVLAFHLSYWTEQLGKTLPFFDLPSDRPRPPLQTHLGARRHLVLPKLLTESLKALSRRESTTLFMTLLAAFVTLLYRYTDRKRIVVGCPIINRNLPEMENLIGSFVNNLVLCIDVSGNPTLREVLSRVRDVCLSSYVHQELPFEKLVEELNPRRDLADSPLFQTMFAFQNTPNPRLSLSDLQSESLEVDAGISKFDLTLSIVDRGQDLSGYVEYSANLFNHSTIERMIGHFRTLLESLVAEPDRPMSTVPLLTEAERHQLLVEWNDTAADYPKDKCIHELFEAQVERTPEAIAVQFERKQLTYGELNRRANQLACYLQGLGIGPEKLVGICVERSLEMVVALLGILKAGGAYVPLDPGYPRERLAFILKDAEVSVLLTQQSLIEDGGWRIEDSESRSSILNHRFQVVCVDRDWETINRENGNNVNSGGRANNVAYVIYTSGSTGTPKGVQIKHRSVINCLNSVCQQIDLTEKDILLAVTTISFDISALETYLPLTIGAKLVLASRDEALDGSQLIGRLTECGATAMQATPSTWKLLLDAGFRSSRNFKILCGGEVLSRPAADQLLEGGASL